MSNYTALQISSALNLDKEREEVLAYGAYAIFLTCWTIILISLFGAIFNVLFEALTISFTTDILRKNSGGVHATSPNRCAVIGTLIFVGLASLINIYIGIIRPASLIMFVLVSFLYTYYYVSKYAPVDTPNKPIRKAEKKLRLRKKSLITVHMFVGIVFLALITYFAFFDYIMLSKFVMCICTGLIWQTFTLTKAGHFFVSKLDVTIKNITSLAKGGENKC
jgi:accessory gene regulator B